MSRIVILGAGESGAGASVLAKKEGFEVFVSDMSKIHDNFRKLDSQLDATSHYILKGWPNRPFHESKITIRFWITSIILAALTIITLKMR